VWSLHGTIKKYEASPSIGKISDEIRGPANR
jgi:hypothetical protein